MVDSHCHLADEVFAADLDAVVARARAAGVTQALCILAAGDTNEAAQAARLSELWPAVRFAVGVHPHQAGQFDRKAPAAADVVRAALSANPAARAIGEIGLDYHYDFSPRDVQREIFRHQVRLACELGMPVVIHMREAEEDTFRILMEEGGGELGGVFHCFTGDAALARRGLELGFHISFAGILTFPRATEIREAARIVPADRLLIETDSPFLAPVPHRGKRNEPAWVRRVVQQLAEIRTESVDSIADAAVQNFAALFRP